MMVNSKIIFWNARGFNRSRRSAVSLYLTTYSPLALAITESKESAASRPLKIPGYVCYRKPHLKGSCGLVLFVKSHLGSVPIPQARFALLESSPHTLFVQCSFPFLQTPVLLGVMYHHRTSASLSSSAWTAIRRDTETAATLGPPCLLLGDFNAHHPSWDYLHADNFGADLTTVASDRSLTILNAVYSPNVVTYPRGQSVIDLCLTSDPSLCSDCAPDPSIPFLSDHLPVSVSIVQAVPHVAPAVSHRRIDIENADWTVFADLLRRWSATTNLQLKALACSGRNPQQTVEEMSKIVTTALRDAEGLAVPSKVVGPHTKHWWKAIPGVPEALEKLRKARRRLSHRKHDPAARQAVVSARREWEAISRRAKAASWDLLCSKIEDSANRRLVWPLWNKVSTESSSHLASILSASGSLPSSMSESVDNLATHFAGVSKPLRERDITFREEAIIKFVHSDVSPREGLSALDADFSCTELDAVCNYLNKSAYFSESVSPLLLRHAPAEWRAVLLTLLNYSWRHGVLPESWRSADVFPIFKGKDADPSLAKSYRPISLTCSLVKLLERLLLHRLVPYLEQKGFFNRFQSGFRREHSTLDQLYRLVDRIQRALEHRHYVSVAFLDIVAAFDTVWHDGLLYKLHKAGVYGRSWRWIKSFLSGRRLRVTHSNFKSQYRSTFAGVPQGSILGPLLFLVFINDIPCADHVCPAIFADDIAVWPNLDGFRGDNALRRSLAEIAEWAARWHVVFSMPKSVVVRYHRKRNPPSMPDFQLGGGSLTRAEEFKYLGLLTHRSLSWSKHTRRTISAANLVAHKICRVLSQNGPSPRIVRQLVLSTVSPIVAYAFPIWQPPSEALWNKLDSALALPLRCALGLPSSVHRQSLLVDFGVLGFRRLHQLRAVAYARRIFRVHHSHPAQELFFARQIQRLHSQPKHAKSRIPFSVSLANAETELSVKHQRTSRLDLHKAAQAAQVRDLLASGSGAFFQRVRDSAQPASYLSHDSRSVAVTRARFRMNRANLNSWLFRYGAIPTSACPKCNDPNEDADHVLLHCPAYDAARRTCHLRFSQLGCPFTVDVLLGSLASVPKVHHRECLAASAVLLSSIKSQRFT